MVEIPSELDERLGEGVGAPSRKRRERSTLNQEEINARADWALRNTEPDSGGVGGIPALWTPLARRGRSVRLDVLESLPDGPDAGIGLSANVKSLLQEAANVTRKRAPDGFAYVDEVAIWHAIFSPSLSTENWAPQTNILTVAHKWLEARAGDGFGDLRKGIADARRETSRIHATLTPGVVALLAAAETFATEVAETPTRFITARHFLFELLAAETLSPGLRGSGLLPESVTGDESALAAFWKSFVSAMGSHVLGDLFKEEADVWKARTTGLSEKPPAPNRRARATSGYLADSTLELPDRSSDPLGAVRDAAALSELICLEAASPPLAIGLFGNWGAGKTTFMRVMNREIDSITADTAERRAAGERLPFVENVVHVWFNAWTYADSGNLWASIATELFRQLSVGGWSGRNKAVTTKYLDQVRTAVQTGGEDVQEKAKNLETIRTSLKSKRQEAAEVEAELRDVEARRTTDRVAHLLDNIAMSNAPDVKRAMGELGLPSAGDTPKPSEVVAAVRDLKGLNAEVTALRRSLFVGDRVGWNWGWLALIALLGVGAFYLVEHFGPLLVEGIGLDISGYFIGTALALGGWLIRAVQMVKKVLGPLTAAETEIERKQRETLQARQASIASEIDKLEDEEDTAEQELRDSREKASSLDALIKGKDERLLAYFIRERWESGGWRDHLGVIAMVQEAIEELSFLLQEDGRKFEADVASGKADGKPAPIQRIVLYIDDLDRCQPEQVAEVLQAVHLLLAYPVFVVVVGVDPDWLSRALVKVYPGQIGPTADTDAPTDAGTGLPHATVSDYLEKIFQVPYWLTPLSGTDDTRYQRLVNRMIGRELDEIEKTGQHEQQFEFKNNPDLTNPNLDVSKINLKRYIVTDRTPPRPPVIERESAEIWEGVKLTDPEVRLMRKLGPLAGKSPRAVKRFVNLYRLIRTRAQGDPDFPNGSPPVWPAAMFLLALDVGQPVERQEEFHTFILETRNQHVTKHIDDLLFSVAEKFEDQVFKEGYWRDSIYPALEALKDAEADTTTDHLLPNSSAARAVRRFSMGRLNE